MLVVGIARVKMKEKNRKKQVGDLGMAEEIFELVKNLVSIESHSFNSFVSSGEKKYLELSKEARKMRTKYLSMITKNEEQCWCISKHICESAMRLQELYTRFLSTSQDKEAKVCAEDYKLLENIFVIINNLGGSDENVSEELPRETSA